MNIQSILSSLGVESKNSGAAIGAKWLTTNGNTISSSSPVDGNLLGEVTARQLKKIMKIVFVQHRKLFVDWRMVSCSSKRRNCRGKSVML